MTLPSTVSKLPLVTPDLTNRQRLAEEFIQTEKLKHRHYAYWHSQWWMFRGTNYISIDEGVVNQNIFKFIEEEFRERRFDGQKIPSITRSILADVAACVKMKTQVDAALEPPFSLSGKPDDGWHISLANGVLDVDEFLKGDVEKALRPHSPDWFSPAALPVNFDPSATSPTWDKFILEVFEGDQERVKFWEEWMGYCCVWDYSFQHAVIMVGEGRNGKGVCQKVIVELLGQENVSAVPLGQFNDKFGLSSMLGKLANIAGEIQGAGHTAEERLKQITGHDLMDVNIKYKESVITRIPARLVFATNDVPEFKDRSKGLWRRLIIVPFNWEVPADKADPKMAEKLVAELPGIFNRSLQGLRRLLDQGHFTVPGVSTEATSVYQAESNPARRFLSTQTFIKPEVAVPTADLYEFYRDWCKKDGCSPFQILSRPAFSKEVKRYYRGKVEHKKMWLGDDQPYKWFFTGLYVPDIHSMPVSVVEEKAP